MRPLSVVTCLFALLSTGCSGDDGSCIEVTADCAPLYQPTFDNVFSRTLQPTCGIAGASCHASEGAQGGIVFDTIDQSYQLIVTDRALVDTTDIGCSDLLRRTESTDSSFVMPPGGQLSEAERCAIRQWVDNGAAR